YLRPFVRHLCQHRPSIRDAMDGDTLPFRWSARRSAAMNYRAALSTLCVLFLLPTTRAGELAPDERAAVDKALAWLVKQQHRDGHWEGQGGQYPMSMTGMAGIALLLDGNTPREGRYKEPLRRATDYLLSKSQPNGQIGNPNLPGEAGRYMYAHAYSMWFLAEVYGEVEDVDVRKKMEDVLTRAVKFAKEAQTTRGGWGYVTAKDGSNFDEGAITFVQIHALISARNAGIPVPREMLDKAYDYCVKSQNGK